MDHGKKGNLSPVTQKDIMMNLVQSEGNTLQYPKKLTTEDGTLFMSINNKECKNQLMFTQPCFIRKNTPELRKKLQELGQRANTLDDFKGEWLAANYGMYISVQDGFQHLHPNDIDCGTNEDLFLAIASLRDDTDKGQWFIYDSMDAVIESFRVYEWLICNEDKIEDMFFYDSLYLNTHKATVQELIEHFSKKEEKP